MIVSDASENLTHARTIVDLAGQMRLPAIYPYPAYVKVGGLMAYTAELEDIVRRSVGYIDRIFRGASPGDLPYQLPAKFDLLINRKTAKALADDPAVAPAGADQVIE